MQNSLGAKGWEKFKMENEEWRMAVAASPLSYVVSVTGAGGCRTIGIGIEGLQPRTSYQPPADSKTLRDSPPVSWVILVPGSC